MLGSKDLLMKRSRFVAARSTGFDVLLSGVPPRAMLVVQVRGVPAR
jgi:hypothetical protein